MVGHVAGAQPAVGGELRGAALAAVVLARRSTGRRPGSRRSSVSSHGSGSPVAGSARRSSTSGGGGPAGRGRRRGCPRPRRRTASAGAPMVRRGRLGHAPGVQDRQADGRPVGLGQRPGDGRPAAEDPPAATTGRTRSSCGSAPIQIVGTPAVTVTRWRSSMPRIARRGHVRPGEHQARPGQQRRRRACPRRWRGTSAPPAGRRPAPTARPVDGQRDQRVQQRRAVAVDHALRVAGGAGAVAHRRGAVLVVDANRPSNGAAAASSSS